MTTSTVTHTYNTCGKQIHEDCDMFKHMKRIGNYKCPRDLVSLQYSQKNRKERMDKALFYNKYGLN